MNFESDVRAIYNRMHNYATRDCRVYAAQHKNAYPEVLDSFLDEKKISQKVDAGSMNIPMDRITGIATSSEEQMCYTRDFLPLAPADSAFAETWCSLYLDCFSDEGIRNPIDCYEYLGRFFITDGKKRVSVLKCFGVTTISARVIRLIPDTINDPEAQHYRQFLEQLQLTGLYQTDFNQPKDFEKLQAALGHECNYAWTENDRFGFMLCWYGFDMVFKRVFGKDRHVNAAEMFTALLEEYSYREIMTMHPGELEKVLRAAQKKLYGGIQVHLMDVFPKVS